MEFQQTPLFQLNLFLALGLPGNASYFRPIFLERGFELYGISPKIITNIQTITASNVSNGLIKLKLFTNPDIMFRSSESKQIIIVECKLSRFPVASEQANQISTILTHKGNEIANYFGFTQPNLWSNIFQIAVSEANGDQTYSVIKELAKNLEDINIRTCDFGVVEIIRKKDGVFLSSINPDQRSVYFENEQVAFLDEDDDPRPLYIIPIDPSIDSGDPYGKLVLRERIRISLVEKIGSNLGFEDFSINIDDIFRSVIPVWDQWLDNNSKKNLKRLISRYINSIITNISRLGSEIYISKMMIICKGNNSIKALKIQHYLLSKEFRTGDIDLISSLQPELSGTDEW